jgi:hypothetical protein
MGSEMWTWEILSGVSMVAIGALSYLWFHSFLTDVQSVYAVALFASMSGVSRISGRFPILVDAASLAVLFGVVVLMMNGRVWEAVALSFLAGMMNEKIGIFAALIAWNPIPLVSLFSTAILYALGKDVKTGIEWIDSPFKAASAAHKVRLFSYRYSLATWGVLPLCVGFMSMQTIATLFVAYAQLLRSQDYARLIMWAAPVVVLNFVQVCPVNLLAGAMMLHIYLVELDETV